MLSIQQLQDARNRIGHLIHQTPILESKLINKWSGGHRVFFKAECLQKTGAFKARGALNAVSNLVERGEKPAVITANSSGNHAQAIAWASAQYFLKSRIFMPSNVSNVKAMATAAYGADIVYGSTRSEVDQMVEDFSKVEGVHWIPPFNHPDVIAGQGTATLEAGESLENLDAVFAPCGGGGLLSGTLIAARHLNSKTKVFGAEPKQANDAAQSLRQGFIHRLEQPPITLADGARTLSVSELTFEHLQQLDGFYEIAEEDLIYWTQWLNHLLKVRVEPTSAMPMQAAWEYLKTCKTPQRVLIIISGGNMDRESLNAVYQADQMAVSPGDR